MNYYDRIIELISETARRVSDLGTTGATGTSVVTSGRHGVTSGYGRRGGRLVGRGNRQVARASELLGQHTTGPKRKLPGQKKIVKNKQGYNTSIDKNRLEYNHG